MKVTCYHCGEWFTWHRRPNQPVFHVCPDCRKNEIPIDDPRRPRE